jgi:aryl-alcohol dehydrogenase-like predicted oxidoreductase
MLDVVLVHSDGNEAASESGAARGPMDALDALADLKRAGRVRAIGFSAKTIAGARAAMQRSDVLMLTLNPRELAMLPVIRECEAAGVGVLVKKALISGHVGDGGVTPEACLGLALREPGVASVVVGTLSPEHLRENARVACSL